MPGAIPNPCVLDHLSSYGRACVAQEYGEPSVDDAVLWAEAPEADDNDEGG